MMNLPTVVALTLASSTSAHSVIARLWKPETLVSEQNKANVEEKYVCANGPDETRPVRSGERFKFNLVAEDAICVDAKGFEYQYGSFGVSQGSAYGTADDCTDACVNDVDDFLAEVLLGVDFNCASGKCNCLYSRGDLTTQACEDNDFTSCDFNGVGFGPIDGYTDKSTWSCYKLVGTESIETTSLRGHE